ncbi:MAG TPA: hypothetical protein VHL57_03195 [Flavobacteriales bacterium]|jgi:hypothetical protein|nr:hypothetical protein [Flavobacteriales bacterium]
MKRITLPLAFAICLLSAPVFSSPQQPPKKKPTPPDTTHVDTTHHRMNDTGKTKPAQPDSTTKQQPRR